MSVTEVPASTRPRRESLGTARGLVDGLAWSKAGAIADKRKVVEPELYHHIVISQFVLWGLGLWSGDMISCDIM